MITKTKGIVLNYIKYKETSIIVRIFTEKLGLQSYIVNSIRTKGKTNKISYYQPLTLLDLVVYSNPKSELNRISETQFAHKYISIPFDIRKSTINLFLAEVISKLILEEEENNHLFHFLESSLIQFDQLEDQFTEFHLYIILHVLDFLGHSIPLDETDPLEKQLLLLRDDYSALQQSNRKNRNQLLHFILDFYRQHSQLHLELKSLPVLEAIFE